jgi:hypothetical protein
MRRIALAFVLLATLASSSGCLLLEMLGLPTGGQTPYNPKLEDEGVAVQRNIQFNDIPVPMAFKLRRDRFYSYSCATFRIGEFYYEGAWTYRRTKAFYEEQMPISGWSRLSEEIGDRQAREHWAKGSDRLRIVYDVSGEYVAVHMQLYPVGSEPPLPELK